MSSMDDRERAFETKFAHDAEMQFKAEARRNKLLGQWAAELLGKTGAAAEEYAKSIVVAARSAWGRGLDLRVRQPASFLPAIAHVAAMSRAASAAAGRLLL